MAGRLDPPHDRLTLSAEEVRTLARLERALAEEATDPGGTGGPGRGKRRRLSGLRTRFLMISLRWSRLGPWLVPVGIVLMLTALSSSVLLSALGVVLLALGATACIRRPWLRARVAGLRDRLLGRDRPS
jgi:hypothetical protein